MIVRYFCILLRFGQDFLQSIEGKSDRADPHGSSIAPAIIGRAVRRACPLMEKTTIPGIGVTERIGFLHSYVLPVGQGGVGYGYGERAVIGEGARGAEELKSLRLD